MSRYRPPSEASTAIITRDGFETLKTELNFLWKEKRPEVVKALAAAAAEGDRSENAEYTYRKKQLGEIDRRVRYLSKRIEQLKVVDQIPENINAIYFGAWFEIEHIDSCETSRYRIVGPDETDAKAGFISIDSPMARAVLKKRVEDEFEVQLPTGLAKFYILQVQYSAFA
jgi:transcription elongation factor GreB